MLGGVLIKGERSEQEVLNLIREAGLEVLSSVFGDDVDDMKRKLSRLRETGTQ